MIMASKSKSRWTKRRIKGDEKDKALAIVNNKTNRKVREKKTDD